MLKNVENMFKNIIGYQFVCQKHLQSAIVNVQMRFWQICLQILTNISRNINKYIYENLNNYNLIKICFPTALAISRCQWSLSDHYHHSCHATADRDLHSKCISHILWSDFFDFLFNYISDSPKEKSSSHLLIVIWIPLSKV